jgi:hypothetical protein
VIKYRIIPRIFACREPRDYERLHDVFRPEFTKARVLPSRQDLVAEPTHISRGRALRVSPLDYQRKSLRRNSAS